MASESGAFFIRSGMSGECRTICNGTGQFVARLGAKFAAPQVMANVLHRM
jgi:hypothetical protein